MRRTIGECFQAYDRRFARAMANLPDRRPWTGRGRDEILRAIRRVLGIRRGWIPRIRPEVVRTSTHEGFQIEHLAGESWPGVVATANLYLPRQAGGPSALVVLCCGHGAGGKLHDAYQRMARLAVRSGAMVLVPDNIGQGERTPMGHADPVEPFACGLTVLGLIVMETLGWIGWARRDRRVDPARVASIGNSGGGHLSALVGALRADLAAVSSSGRPGTYAFTARKERRLCHCALMPGVVGVLEMWHVLGCVAPRPMFLFQGLDDRMFPADEFRQVAHRVQAVYERRGAGGALRAEMFPGGHSWDPPRRAAVKEFLVESLSLPVADAVEPARERLLRPTDTCLPAWPGEALDTDGLACRLSGKAVPPGLALWDVFAPVAAPPDHDARHILAQFEAFLAPEGEPAA